MTDEPQGRDSGGEFSHGNTIWQLRKTFGRPIIYDDPEELWTACCAYFQWANDNPLKEAKVLANGDQVSVAKLRALTQRALCLHLQISDETWRGWRANRSDLQGVISAVDDVIFTQKFEGAAAGLLHANIVSRALGLAERSELSGAGGGPILTTGVPLMEVARGLAFILASAHETQKDQQNSKPNEE